MSTEYFNIDTNAFSPSPRVDAFLRDLIEVYKKHELSLGHEDAHGAFIIQPLTDGNINWLQNAMLGGELREGNV